MGTLQCIVCKSTVEANSKAEGISKIDHGSKSKKCSGKDELCQWYASGIPEIKPDEDIDPKRPIEGVKVSATVETKKSSAPKKTDK